MTKPTARKDAATIETLKAQALENFEEALRNALEAQIKISGQIGFLIDVDNPPVELSDSFAQGSDDVVANVLGEYEALGWKTNGLISSMTMIVKRHLEFL